MIFINKDFPMKTKNILIIALLLLSFWNISLLITKKTNQSKLKFIDYYSDLKYKEFPVSDLEFKEKKNVKNKIQNKFNIYLLFSMSGCQACLKRQVKRLKNISIKYNNILHIYAVNIDSTKKGLLYLFKKTYGGGFILSNVKRSIIPFTKINEVPALFFTTKDNIVLDLNIPESRYYSNRYFYKNVELILDNVKHLTEGRKTDFD